MVWGLACLAWSGWISGIWMCRLEMACTACGVGLGNTSAVTVELLLQIPSLKYDQLTKVCPFPVELTSIGAALACLSGVSVCIRVLVGSASTHHLDTKIIRKQTQCLVFEISKISIHANNWIFSFINIFLIKGGWICKRGICYKRGRLSL